MAEHLLGYLNTLAVAERLGRALAGEALTEARDGAVERQRQRARRARVVRVLRALAVRLVPVPQRRPLPAGR